MIGFGNSNLNRCSLNSVSCMVDVFTHQPLSGRGGTKEMGTLCTHAGREPCGPVGASESVKERVLRGESVLLATFRMRS